MSTIDRRTMLAFGGATVAAGLVPAAATAGRTQAAGILFFDPASATARAMARQTRGQRLIALAGDPVRLWRDTVDARESTVGGITRWSDYLLLRELAAEHGLRIRREEYLRSAGQPMLVHWAAA